MKSCYFCVAKTSDLYIYIHWVGLSPPSQDAIVANEGLVVGIPKPKHEIILVVTIASWGGGRPNLCTSPANLLNNCLQGTDCGSLQGASNRGLSCEGLHSTDAPRMEYLPTYIYHKFKPNVS